MLKRITQEYLKLSP